MPRLAKKFAGFSLVIAGAAMLVLPGPGVLTIVAGVGLLGQEYEWARRLERWGRSKLPGRSDDQEGG
ncbi:MAG: PGPGW domain-containing protein [Acidimicrobiia bacterium]